MAPTARYETLDYGEFVDSDDGCDVESEAEPRYRYESGWYYPLCIGEVPNHRYRVEHKLGWGGFSTLWLAYNLHQEKAVALKITLLGHRAEHEHYM